MIRMNSEIDPETENAVRPEHGKQKSSARESIGGADAGEALRGHGLEGVVGAGGRVFVGPHEGLGVEFEGLSHEFGDTRQVS